MLATIELEQGGLASRIDGGSFIFLSAAKPYSAAIAPCKQKTTFSTYLVKIPEGSLRQRVPAIDFGCLRPARLKSAAARIMQMMLHTALCEGGTLLDWQAEAFGSMLVDAIANVALESPELAAARPCTREASLRRLRDRATNIIKMELADPGLSVATLAAQCGVSPRYLHSAFADAAITVGSYIRTARLERCRQALQCESLAQRSIIDIAVSWGFNDAAYFSRAYRCHFGRSPREERIATRPFTRYPRRKLPADA